MTKASIVNIKSITLILALFLFISCDSATIPFEKRSQYLTDQKRKAVIGVVDSSSMSSLFNEGVKLAVDEINSSGRIMDKQIVPLYLDDKGGLKKGQNVSHKLSGNKDVIAAIGHRYSEIALSASITYEKSGILFIATGAADLDLVRESNRFTFRNIPSDEDFARETAFFVKREKYKNIAIILDSESSGKRVADIFHENANILKLNIVAKKAYSKYQNDFRYLISDLMRSTKFDVIFLGGILPSAGIMLKQIREAGIDVPIIGTQRMDTPDLMQIAGKAANKVIIPTTFDPKLNEKNTMNFIRTFKEKYGVEPDTWAAQGYDAISLIAYAIEKSGSINPATIATTLKVLKKWKSVSGSYSFARNGSITGKSIFFKMINNSNYTFLERGLNIKIDPFEEIKDVTIRIPIEGDPETIDPGLTLDMISIELCEQLFLGLTDYEPKNYEVVPELATKWTVSDDGKTYRFEIRKDVKWTDGTNVTSNDIVWAIHRNIDPEFKCPYASMLYILKNAQEINQKKINDISKIGVKAIDDYTIEFLLEYPASYFPAMAGLWVYRPLPRKIIEKYKDKWTDVKHIVTNGSYKLSAWEKGMVIVLRKNEDYFDAKKVGIPELRYYIIPDSSTGLAMYKNDQLDILGGIYLNIPSSEISKISSDLVLSEQFHQTPQFCTYAYFFNTKIGPVNNPLVRKAISAAIDRKLICDVIYKGTQEPATTFTRPPVFGSVNPKEGVGIHFDPVQAKKWLAEAGFPDGKGFPEIKLLYNVSGKHELVAKSVQTFLEHYLNIKIKLEPKEWSDYINGIEQPNNPHIFRFGWCSDYPDANNWLNEIFNPKTSKNNVGWENKEFSDLMEKAQIEINSEQRKKIYKRAEQILCEEVCAVVPLFFEVHNFLVKPRVKDWYNMALGGQHIRNWYFEE